MPSGQGQAPTLLKVLEQQINESDGRAHDVSAQRSRNHRYYSIQALGNERRGASHYVAGDVFDAVEAKKAYFSATFHNGRDPAVFEAEAGDQDEADAKTAYVNMTLRANDWENLEDDGWHDAFVTKRMVVHLEWLSDSETIEEEVENLTPIEVKQAMQSDPRMVSVNPIEGQESVTQIGDQVLPAYSGVIEIERDTSRVKTTLIQAERWYRDGNYAYLGDGTYCGFEDDVSKGELIRRGYDPEQVRDIRPEYRWRRSEEDSSRKMHDGNWAQRQHQSNRERVNDTVTLFKTWTWLDKADFPDVFDTDGDKLNPDNIGLFEIHWTDGKVLRWADGSYAIKPADEYPFVEWCEYKISHAETGLCTADVLADTQKTTSTLMRLILDNQQRANTSRMVALSQGIEDPRELIENNIGGVIFERIPNAVRALDQPQLSPATFQSIEMLAQDKEKRGAPSRLATGLNQNVIEKQNAADMVDKLMDAGNRRVMKSARDYVNRLRIPVMKMIVKIAAANDEGTYTNEQGGKQVQITPADWSVSELKCSVRTALTPEEQMAQAYTLLSMDQQLTQKAQANPAWGAIYGLEQQHALMDDVFDAMGISDASRYMAAPGTDGFNQSMQQVQQQMQQQQQQQMQQMQQQMQFLESADRREWFRAQIDGQKLQVDATDRAQDNTREDERLEHTKVIDWAKVRQSR